MVHDHRDHVLEYVLHVVSDTDQADADTFPSGSVAVFRNQEALGEGRRMRLFNRRVCQGLWLVACCLLTTELGVRFLF